MGGASAGGPALSRVSVDDGRSSPPLARPARLLIGSRSMMRMVYVLLALAPPHEMFGVPYGGMLNVTYCCTTSGPQLTGP